MGIGGTELNAVRSVERLPSERYHVRVVALHDQGPVRARYDALGVEVFHLPVGPLYSMATMRAIVRLARYLRAQGIDVVHCHDRYTNFVGVIAGRLAGVKLVLASKRWGETTARHQLVSRIAFRAAHAVVANGPGTAWSLQQSDGVSADRIVVVPNFVDDEMFVPAEPGWIARERAALGIAEGVPVGVIIASLRPVKDHGTLLRALPRIRESLPEFILLVVGDGPSRSELQQLAGDLGVGEGVRFSGIRPQHPSAHHLGDVSFLTSRSEGFPNSLVEAMAAGKAIVATDVTGIRDAVVPEENGLLVPAGDHAALAGAVLRLMADPVLRTSMGARGRQIARERFAAPVALSALTGLYDSAKG